MELQRQTGADIFVYFSREAPPDEAGLCRWFEKSSLNNHKVRDYLRDYIKVQIPLPSNPDCQELATSFEVRKCPAVFVVQTNAWRQYCKVFDWSSGRPEPFPPEELVKLLRARSGERYQVPDE